MGIGDTAHPQEASQAQLKEASGFSASRKQIPDSNRQESVSRAEILDVNIGQPCVPDAPARFDENVNDIIREGGL